MGGCTSKQEEPIGAGGAPVPVKGADGANGTRQTSNAQHVVSDTPSEPILQHSQAQSPTKKSLEPAVSDPGRESSGEGKDHVPALPSDLPAPLPIRKSGAPRTSANSYRSGAIRSSAASQGSQTAASSCDEHSGQAAARPPSRFQTQMDLCRAVFKTQWVKIALSPSELTWYNTMAGLGLGQAFEQDDGVASLENWALAPSRQGQRVMVWNDTREDAETAEADIVKGHPGVRFYARCALAAGPNQEGNECIGFLCVADSEARDDFSPLKITMLSQFADLVLKDLEQSKLSTMQTVVAQHQMLEPTSQAASGASRIPGSATTVSDKLLHDLVPKAPEAQGLARAVEFFKEAALVVDVSQPASWRIVHFNGSMRGLMGGGDWLPPRDFDALLSEPGGSGSDQTRPSGSQPFTGYYTLKHGEGTRTVSVEFRPIASEALPPPNPDAAVQPSATPPRYNFAMVHPIRDSDGYGTPGALGSEGSSEEARVTQWRPAGRPMSMDIGAGLPSLRQAKSSVFSDVQLGPLIGRGAYGRVYRGSWNGNTVAVKVLETDNPEVEVIKENGSVKKAGLFEAALSSSISHPNVAHTYMYAVRQAAPAGIQGASRSASANIDAVLDGTVALHQGPAALAPSSLHEVWIVSEFCNLGPLLTAIERGAFLTQSFAAQGQPNLVSILQTLQEIAAALAYLHANDILHGDLTGGNVLLAANSKDGRGFTAKVVDFGLSRLIGSESYLRTRTLGCAEYMPPELIIDGLLTKAGDVYAFGVVLWELYMGTRAWEGLKTSEVLNHVASKRSLVFPPSTPHRLKVLGTRCLAFNPDDRPTFSDILVEVDSVLKDTQYILRKFLARNVPI
uniref:Protein kinase domain-containing protein n=2 Tax=Auxenochlorella protothecoides TaxID=3075 RepID=A0A1D2ABN9_AUXPR